MKKFLKLVVLGAFIAGITWVLRDQLLPGPTQPTSHPPAFRGSPRPATPADSPAADDLTEVNGIGPVYAARLHEVGITSFAQLAAADAAELAGRADLSPERIADWIAKAADLA